MKVYFAASLTGKKFYKKNYQLIFECLKKLDCRVKHGDIFSKTREEIDKKDRQERIAFIKFLSKGIKWCDVLVVEVSYPSTSVGYEMSMALRKNRPVLALYFESKGDCPSVFKAVSDLLKEEDFTLIEYNFNNLESLLRNYLDFIKTKGLNKRFTLLFSPKVNNFLTKIVREEKIPRSVYIRKLIEEDMKKRKEKLKAT